MSITNSMAHAVKGGYFLIPDRVATNQKFYSDNKKPFAARRCDICGNPIGGSRMVILRGDLYGLGTDVTGDMVVSTFGYPRK